MPSVILAAGEGVHVDDGVDPLRRTCVDNTTQELEAVWLEHRRVAVIYEVPMVHRNTDAIQP